MASDPNNPWGQQPYSNPWGPQGGAPPTSAPGGLGGGNLGYTSGTGDGPMITNRAPGQGGGGLSDFMAHLVQYGAGAMSFGAIPAFVNSSGGSFSNRGTGPSGSFAGTNPMVNQTPDGYSYGAGGPTPPPHTGPTGGPFSSPYAQFLYGQAGGMQSGWSSAGAQAQGYYNTPANYWQSLYGPGGSMAGPGAAETAYDTYGGRFINDTRNSQNTLDQYGSQLAGPSASEQWNAANQYRYTQPTTQQDFYQRNAWQYADNPFSDAYAGLFGASAPGRSVLQQNFQGLNNQLDGATNLDTQGAGIRDIWNSSGVLSGDLGNLRGQANDTLSARSGQAMAGYNAEQGPGYTQRAGGEIGGLYQGANATQGMFGSERGQLQGPGMYERFVQGALAGNDPYYARLQQEQTADLDASMNARGGYNSGAALKALGNQNAALYADRYHQLADMAQGAQGAEMSRLAQGMGAAGQYDQSRLAQGNALQGLAGQSESEYQDRLRARESISSSLFGNRQSTTSMLGGFDVASGQEKQSMAQGLGNLANMTDTQRMQRMQEQDQLTNATASNYLAMLQNQGSLANTAANQKLAYLTGQQNAAQGADTSYLAMLNAGGTAAQNASRAQVDRLAQLGTQANNADTQNRQGLADLMTASERVQRLRFDQANAGMTSAGNLANNQAESVFRAQQGGSDAYMRMLEDAMGGQSHFDANRTTQGQNKIQNTLAAAGLGVNVISQVLAYLRQGNRQGAQDLINQNGGNIDVSTLDGTSADDINNSLVDPYADFGTGTDYGYDPMEGYL